MKYADVPKDLVRNLIFRRSLMADCAKNPKLAASIKVVCAKDLLFWLNVFGFTHDPRRIEVGENPVLPFITYPFQDTTLLKMEDAFGRRDQVLVKTRGVSGTWMLIALFTHRWQFWKNLSMGLVSREERLVDGSPKALFYKIDFMIERQPGFLTPREGNKFRKELLLVNRETGSAIEGATTTGDMFRGDRYTAIGWDEVSAVEHEKGMKAMASTQGTTNCRYIISTPQGKTGAFAELAHNKKIERIDLHWKNHPEMAKGLVTLPSGKISSPWYQKECDRLVIPALIAAELDLDFAGSGSPFFPGELIDKMLDRDVRRPVLRGRLHYDRNHPQSHPYGGMFLEDSFGDLLLWQPVDPGSSLPPYSEYVIGCDISQGTGATNSVLSVADKKTREKIAELATPILLPDQFAEMVAAVGWWFYEAQIIWEKNGPGGSFGKRLTDLGYSNIYLQHDEQGLTNKLSVGLVPGWNASPQNTMMVFREYVRCLGSGLFINRSEEAVKECRHYVYLPNGQVGNTRARTTTDNSAARANHGDRVIADALCCKLLGPGTNLILSQRPTDDPLEVVNPEPYSWAWRRQQAHQESLRKDDPWKSEPNWDRQWREDPRQMSPW